MKSLLSLYAFCWISALAFGNVSKEDLFPFGVNNGDSIVPATDDGSSGIIQLHRPYYVGKNYYSSLFVNNDGGISFDNSINISTPVCSNPLPTAYSYFFAYWADSDTSQGLGGEVYYRESTDQDLLDKATAEIQAARPSTRNLKINAVFIATWHEVTFAGAADCNHTYQTAPRNTFQAVIAAVDTPKPLDYRSYLILNYNNVTWTTGRKSGGDCSGLGGEAARAGTHGILGYAYNVIAGSCTSDIINIAGTSNSNSPGKYVWKLE